MEAVGGVSTLPDNTSLQNLIAQLDRVLKQNHQATVLTPYMSSGPQPSRKPSRTLEERVSQGKIWSHWSRYAYEPGAAAVKLTDLHMERGCAGGLNQTLDQKDVDWELWYENTSAAKSEGMLDSMACTVNEDTASRMLEENVITQDKQLSEQVILIGCGGHQTHPKCAYEVEIEVYGTQCIVPILVVPGQKDDLILGSNVIKYLMHEMKSSDDYWRVTAQNCDVSEDPDTFQFLNMMAGVTRWQGAKVPSKIGTVKLTQAVTLLAGHEHLVWGRLPKNTLLTPGSTVIVEPTSSKSMPRNILVGRVITPMWGDGYIPMKIMNLSDQPVTLKRNCKLADVSPCVAAEDFTVFQNTSQVETKDQSAAYPESNCADLEKKLAEVGLKDIDINFCQISHSTQQELVLLVSYNDIFSKHALDCGEAKGFSHRIHLTDERPFRLPYRRVPPAHYQKLRQALTEMEEQGIIRKSTSEFASPLVMIWKKDGSLRICTDCTNSQTVWRLWAGMSISVLWT
ncbi:Transposon Tf2-8 polyprotein [Labeo rohita]|uniref:Transposon Tf2-8 polyprotein n=1 Tax=Labeo rohita TaxID=84645 RepID=A0ABQ8N084_LABRO|nr:Transposon Tf2-8 polyprotein [Labeo rohita]